MNKDLPPSSVRFCDSRPVDVAEPFGGIACGACMASVSIPHNTHYNPSAGSAALFFLPPLAHPCGSVLNSARMGAGVMSDK